MSLPAINPDLLTPTLRELVELIGLPETLNLVEALGGTRVWVREKPDPADPLASILSGPAYQKLCKSYRLEYLEINKGVAALRQVRNQQIVDLRHQGMTIRELALRFKLTERQIFSIIADAETPEDRTQLSLID